MRAAASRGRDKVTYEWLFAQSKAQHGRIAVLSLLCTVQAAVLVGFALACRSVIDQAVTGNVDGLLLAAAALAGISVAQLALRLAINGMQERIRARLALELRKRCSRTHLPHVTPASCACFCKKRSSTSWSSARSAPSPR